MIVSHKALGWWVKASTEPSSLRQYFDLLDANDLEGLSGLFTERATYLRPRISPTGQVTADLEVMQGREEISAFLRQRRQRDYGHRLHALSGSRSQGTEIAEGSLVGPGAPRLVFMACASVTATGQISRFMAMSLELVPGSFNAVLNSMGLSVTMPDITPGGDHPM